MGTAHFVSFDLSVLPRPTEAFLQGKIHFVKLEPPDISMPFQFDKL